MPILSTFGDHALVLVDRLGHEPTSRLGEPIVRRLAEPILRRHFLASSEGRSDLRRVCQILFGYEVGPDQLEGRFEQVLSYLGDSPRSGALLVLYRRPEAGAPSAIEVEESEPRTAEPVVEEETETWFEVLVVDEVGEPVPGVDVEFLAGKASGVATTDGSGVARVDGAEVRFATAWLPDVTAALSTLEPRWKKERSGDPPAGQDVFDGPLVYPFRRCNLKDERRYTLVVHSPLMEVQAEKLTFDGNHGVMKANQDDWLDKGGSHPSPEWKRGDSESAPVSYTKGETVRAEVELSAKQSPGPARPVDLSGALARLALEGKGTVRGDEPKLTVESSAPLPDRLAVLKGNLDWTALVDGERYRAGSTPDQKILVTMDEPISLSGYPEDGITEKRLEASVRLLAEGKTLDPHELVNYVMKKFKYYTLRPSEKVPEKYNHPTFFNDTGGAWPMFDYLREYGECQAICRFSLAAVKQVGCPGAMDVVMVWAEPDHHNGEKAKEGVMRGGLGRYPTKTVNGCRSAACLVDAYPVEGEIYDYKAGSSRYIGLNTFEACLRVDHGGVKKYYGGGAGTYDSPEEVLTAFQALAWVSWSDKRGRPHVAEWTDRSGKKKTGPGVRIEKVVKRWRDSSGNLI